MSREKDCGSSWVSARLQRRNRIPEFFPVITHPNVAPGLDVWVSADLFETLSE